MERFLSDRLQLVVESPANMLTIPLLPVLAIPSQLGIDVFIISTILENAVYCLSKIENLLKNQKLVVELKIFRLFRSIITF